MGRFLKIEASHFISVGDYTDCYSPLRALPASAGTGENAGGKKSLRRRAVGKSAAVFVDKIRTEEKH